MADSLRNHGRYIAIPLLVVLIIANALVAGKNLKRLQRATQDRVESAVMQARISDLMLDLDDMETGQRGYLLTGDPAYLRPYTDANARLAAHLSSLRSRLTVNLSTRERTLEANLEPVIQSLIAEMEETIRLRERGYRHRAFLLVNSNRGKELMDEARTTLNALSSAQAGNVSRYDTDLRDSVQRAYKELALTNSILLVVTVVTLLAFNTYSRRLELRCARHSEQLRATSIQIECLTSALAGNFRVLVAKTRSYTKVLLELYGGFLPRQGQEQAECIEDAVRQMDYLLDDLLQEPESHSSVEVTEIQSAEKLTA